MSEKPLHAQVAEALGWVNVHERESSLTGPKWWGTEPTGLTMTIPRYDSAWCSAGPLVERFKISVCFDAGQGWYAFCPIGDPDIAAVHEVFAATPPESVCRLIVELHKKGLLKP